MLAKIQHFPAIDWLTDDILKLTSKRPSLHGNNRHQRSQLKNLLWIKQSAGVQTQLSERLKVDFHVLNWFGQMWTPKVELKVNGFWNPKKLPGSQLDDLKTAIHLKYITFLIAIQERFERSKITLNVLIFDCLVLIWSRNGRFLVS